MTFEYPYLCLLCGLGGWVLGATLADPGYLAGGLRSIWAQYVRMFRSVRQLLARN